LTEKEILNKKRDIEEEKELLYHLSIITKIILHNEINVFWKEKNETWRQRILQFAELNTDITQQMMASWKNAKC